MRESGPTRLIVYCADYKRAFNYGRRQRWGEDTRLSELEPRFKCKVCGHRGADIRPLFENRRGNWLAHPLPIFPADC
jgi:hypothetical protein